MVDNQYNPRLIVLDFDGVIVDSIEECYRVSKDVYYGYNRFPFDEVNYKKLFYRFRGFVGPAYEYFVLHKILEENISGKEIDLHKFNKLKKSIRQAKLDFFESLFFFTRTHYQKANFDDWAALNPLTTFGKSLVTRDNNDIYIVTTKNRLAVESLLKHHNISVKKIYANDEVKKKGSKGILIEDLLNHERASEAYFVDDSTFHLDTVTDQRVKCFFADWGYGENDIAKPYQLADGVL